MEKEKFQDKIRAVAQFLNMKADFSRTETFAYNAGYLKAPNGTAEVFVTNGGGWHRPGENRICFSGNFPRDKKGDIHTWGDDDKIDITVSCDRPPLKIAQELNRRFFPKYYEIYERVQVRTAEADQALDQKAGIIAELGRYFGESLKDEHNRDPQAVYVRKHFPELSSSIELNSEGKIRFTLHLPLDRALKVFDMVQGRGGDPESPDLIKAAEEIIEWGAQMGGWEAPAWDRLRAALRKANERPGPAPKAIILQDGDRTIPVEIETTASTISVKAEGYGDHCSEDGHGVPAMFELYEGEFRAILWPDINTEDPTIISLEGAREDNRNEEQTATG